MTSSFFFFQAEDGIRDLTVTGVQTCALPILPHRPRRRPRRPRGRGRRRPGAAADLARLGARDRRHGGVRGPRTRRPGSRLAAPLGLGRPPPRRGARPAPGAGGGAVGPPPPPPANRPAP